MHSTGRRMHQRQWSCCIIWGLLWSSSKIHGGTNGKLSCSGAAGSRVDEFRDILHKRHDVRDYQRLLESTLMTGGPNNIAGSCSLNSSCWPRRILNHRAITRESSISARRRLDSTRSISTCCPRGHTLRVGTGNILMDQALATITISVMLP